MLHSRNIPYLDMTYMSSYPITGTGLCGYVVNHKHEGYSVGLHVFLKADC